MGRGHSRIEKILEAPEHRRCLGVLTLLEASLVAASSWRASGVAAWIPWWSIGLVSWSLIEYALHRGPFHLPRAHPLAGLGARQHLDHHDAPSRWPISKPLRLTLPAIGLAIEIAWQVGDVAIGVVAGLVAGYFVYELAHVAAHCLVDDHPWPELQARHLEHHRDARRWFGITSSLWDHVLRTGREGGSET